MKLIIAEKKELAQAISEAIPGSCSQTSPYIVKGDYTITWCSGHLLALKGPEDYDASYKKWEMNQLPIYFPDWGMKIGSSSGKQTKASKVKLIGELLQKCDMVIHAGDCDDEGQLIVDEILRWHNYQGPVMRLDTSDTTETALRKALASMRDNDAALQREGLVAYARSVSDAPVGYNVTRAMTLANGVLLPVGRVQTPTLGMVVQRERLITGHKKTMYYTISAQTDVEGKTVFAKYEPDSKDPQLEEGRILDKAYAEKIAQSLEGKRCSSIQIAKKKVSESPPLPFNMVKLQVYCGARFGYDNVMNITQVLRDKYKAITYNRSDCQYLGDEHFNQAPETMKFVLANTGLNPVGMDMTIRSKCFNQEKITAHFAIIPTARNVDISQMTEEERNVYLAIAKRYMMQFMPNAQKERSALTAALDDGGTLKATSTELLFPGFLALDKDLSNEEEEKSVLSQIPAGTYSGQSHDAKVDAKETKPPSRYTIATLCDDMTRIAKYVSDPEAKKMLIEKDKDKDNENGSIGTPATREAIVKSLIARELIVQQKRNLVPTPKGMELYDATPDAFRLADTTAKWWTIQEDIRMGAEEPDALIQSVLHTVEDFLKEPIPRIKQTSVGKVVVGKCLVCGGDVIERKTGFACVNYSKDGDCKFYIPKKNPNFPPLAKKEITAATATKLLSGGAISAKNVPKKDGSGTYSVNVKLSKSEDGRARWEMVFPERKETVVGKCPACGGDIIETVNGFMCKNRKEQGCKYFIPKKNEKFTPLSKHTLTAAEMKRLLSGKSVEISGIPKKKGSGTYVALFYLEYDGQWPQWKMKFPDNP